MERAATAYGACTSGNNGNTSRTRAGKGIWRDRHGDGRISIRWALERSIPRSCGHRRYFTRLQSLAWQSQFARGSRRPPEHGGMQMAQPEDAGLLGEPRALRAFLLFSAFSVVRADAPSVPSVGGMLRGPAARSPPAPCVRARAGAMEPRGSDSSTHLERDAPRPAVSIGAQRQGERLRWGSELHETFLSAIRRCGGPFVAKVRRQGKLSARLRLPAGALTPRPPRRPPPPAARRSPRTS
jgi:hypothetical protein